MVCCYHHDRDVPDSVWNRYVKKYGDKYRLVKDEINIWHIKSKFGIVQLYSLLNHQLCFVGDFRSTRHKNAFKKKYSFKHTITQEGDTDVVIVFDEDLLDSAAQALLLYKKKMISDERRKVLAAHMRKIRKLRKRDSSQESEPIKMRQKNEGDDS